jgi:hypothetical protein
MRVFFWLVLGIFSFAIASGSYRFPERHDIMGVDAISLDSMAQFLVANNGDLSQKYAKNLLRIYGEECRREGVRVLVAFAQMCHETRFLKFGHTVRPEQNNFCGYGTINEETRGVYFPTIRDGVRMHVQHLKAYASDRPTCNLCVDQRRALVESGKWRRVDDLSSRWAEDRNYATHLLHIMAHVQNFSFLTMHGQLGVFFGILFGYLVTHFCLQFCNLTSIHAFALGTLQSFFRPLPCLFRLLMVNGNDIYRLIHHQRNVVIL